MKKNMFVTRIITIFLVTLLCVTSVSAAAVQYTRYSTVSNGQATLLGGPIGYWILYEGTDSTYNYLTQIERGVNSWNITSVETAVDFTYATEGNPSAYNASKLRFVTGDYGLAGEPQGPEKAFRGFTAFYSAGGVDVGNKVGDEVMPFENWKYCIIHINNSQIEKDERTYQNEDYYTKARAVRSTVAHEIGHALGLMHHEADEVLMNKDLGIRLIERGIYEPQPGDVAGVAATFAADYLNASALSADTAVEVQSTGIAAKPAKQSLAGFAASYDDICTATFRGYGNIIGMGNGVINLGGHILDDTAYYIENIFVTAQGQELRVLEYIGFGAEKSVGHAVPKNGEYALFLSESQGYRYLVDPQLSLQHVVNGQIVWNPAAQEAIELPAVRMDLVQVQSLCAQ